MNQALIKYSAFSRVPLVVSTFLKESKEFTRFSPTDPLDRIPKLCMNCKYYFEEEGTTGRKRCSRFGTLDNIDGTIYYDTSRIARNYHCKGTYYENYNSSISKEGNIQTKQS